MIQPDEIYATTDIVKDVSKEATEGFGFEHAIEMRRAVQELIKVAQSALSDIESEMIRQVEKHAKTVNGVTYVRGPKKTVTADHERILSLAYRKAVFDSLDENGAIDYDRLGEIMGNIVISLYLSPSTVPKVTGLEHIGADKKDVTTETTKGWKLQVFGDEQ